MSFASRGKKREKEIWKSVRGITACHGGEGGRLFLQTKRVKKERLG